MSSWKFCIPVLAAMAAGVAPVASAQVAFDPSVEYSVNDPERAASGDWDDDGDIDLAVTSDNPDQISVFLNNGDGTFTAAAGIPLANSSSPHGLVAGDFDDNGFVDLAVTLRDLDQVQLVFNTGGTFTPGATYPVGTRSIHLATGTLDGDTSLDLVAVNRDSDDVSVLLNNGDGTFGTTVAYSGGGDPRDVSIGDLDGDGDDDLAVAAHDSSSVVILINDGAGAFTAGPTLSMGSVKPEGVVVADLDDDGDMDVAASGSNGQDVVAVFLQTTPGAFSGGTEYDTGGVEPSGLVAGDFDFDADVDLAVANEETDDVGVLANNGDGTFAAAVNFDVDTDPEHLIAADLDGNGLLDLVSVNSNSNSISVLINSNDSAFTDLGFALAGTNGLPHLEGIGTMTAGSNVRLTITNGLPNTSGFLIIGLSRVNLPLAGGTLVPAPEILIPIQLDANGELVLEGTWPAGVPVGTSTFFQVFLIDSGAVDKLSATNALEGVAQ